MNKQTQPPKFKDFTHKYFGDAAVLDPQKRSELILTYTPLIKYIANRLALRLPAHVAVDDLVSSGIIGLIDAIDKFDPAQNVQFKTYAEFRIKGAMLDELRSLDWVPRSVRRKINDLEKIYVDLERDLGRPATDEEAAGALHLSMDEFYKLLDDTKAVTFLDVEIVRQKATAEAEEIDDFIALVDTDPFAAINLSQMRDLVAKAIDALPQKEKFVVTLYYYEELTMKEIGQVLGYTESRISQMHSKAMFRMRSKLRKAMAA